MAAIINDDRVVFLEETLQTNRNVIAENQQLREQLNSMDEEHRKVLQDVLKELRNLKEGKRGELPLGRAAQRQTRKRQKVQVPPTCRVSRLY